MANDERWPQRPVPAELRARYLAEGWWRDETLGGLVDRSLRAAPDAEVHIWSELRPWHGTYADIHADARRLVTVLADAGIEPGDVVAFQLPNWREAVVAFYGLALGGYVLVPIVHIYGPKEVRFILGQSGARAYISADRYGHVDYLDIVDGAAPGELRSLELHLVVGSADAAPPAGAPPVRVRRLWDVVAAADPVDDGRCRGPRRRLRARLHVGHDERPEGRDAHPPHAARRGRAHRGWITPGSPNLMGSPVTHATGMLGAVLAPMELGEDIHLIDRWDPDRVLDDHARGRHRRRHRRVRLPREHPRPSRLHRRSTHGASTASGSAARRCRLRSGSGPRRTAS